jgi:hypothetical protein
MGRNKSTQKAFFTKAVLRIKRRGYYLSLSKIDYYVILHMHKSSHIDDWMLQLVIHEGFHKLLSEMLWCFPEITCS